MISQTNEQQNILIQSNPGQIIERNLPDSLISLLES